MTEEANREAAEAHAAKSAEDLAYEAGQLAADDSYARRHGIDACPFSATDHSTERGAWLKGLSDALDDQPSIEELRAAVKEETSNV